MSNKKEVVVCAAVEFETDNSKSVIMCLDYIGDPRVENHIFHLADIGVNRDEKYNEVRGFITNKNRFVTPEEALELTGRKSEMRFQKRDYLLPEDLY